MVAVIGTVAVRVSAAPPESVLSWTFTSSPVAEHEANVRKVMAAR